MNKENSKNNKMEKAILLNKLFEKNKEDFYLLEKKIKEVIEEP